jgi:hypothetical protein
MHPLPRPTLRRGTRARRASGRGSRAPPAARASDKPLSHPTRPAPAPRTALGAWNARLWRRLAPLADARGGAATAAALDMLLAAGAGPAAGGAGGAAPAGNEGGGLHLLVPWAAAPGALAPALRHPAMRALTAVEPSPDGAAGLGDALGLAPPDGVAHDGWQRRVAPRGRLRRVAAHQPRQQDGVEGREQEREEQQPRQHDPEGQPATECAVYRGNIFMLTPPVLSLAGDVDAVWDRWGLLVAPPPLRRYYACLLADLLARRQGGRIVLAAAVDDDSVASSGGGGGGGAGGSNDGADAPLQLHRLSEADLAAFVQVASEAAGLRLVRRAPLEGQRAEDSACLGNTLLLFAKDSHV